MNIPEPFVGENILHSFDVESVRQVFNFPETYETSLPDTELSSTDNSLPHISFTPHYYNESNFLQTEDFNVKKTNIFERLVIQTNAGNIFNDVLFKPYKNDDITETSLDSSQLYSFEHWEPVSATDNPQQSCYNLHEPIRISRFVKVLKTADLYSSSSLSTSSISSIQLDAPPDAKELKPVVLYSLLASVGQYTLVNIQTPKQEAAWSRSASSATPVATKSMYLQCTQCFMRVPLSELSRLSALNPITHTAEILSKFSAQHDAECISRLALNRLRSKGALKPIEEGQLESSRKSIGTHLRWQF